MTGHWLPRLNRARAEMANVTVRQLCPLQLGNYMIGWAVAGGLYAAVFRYATMESSLGVGKVALPRSATYAPERLNLSCYLRFLPSQQLVAHFKTRNFVFQLYIHNGCHSTRATNLTD